MLKVLIPSFNEQERAWKREWGKDSSLQSKGRRGEDHDRQRDWDPLC